MSIDRTKTLTGPFTLDLLNVTSESKFKIENLKKDKVTFDILRDVDVEELEDGSEEYFKGGGKLKIEANFSEVDNTQLGASGVEDTSIVTVELSFPNKNKKITITVDVLTGGDLIYGEVSGGKGKVTILKSIPLDEHIDDVITIAPIT